MDRVVYRLDVVLSVVFKHAWPVYASVFEIYLGLYIENPGHSGFGHLFHIILKLRVGSDKNPGIVDLVE